MESPFENERGQNPKNEKGTLMQARNPQPKRQAHSLPTPSFPNAREQIPHMPHMRISQKVKGILMQNPQHIVFI